MGRKLILPEDFKSHDFLKIMSQKMNERDPKVVKKYFIDSK